MGDTGLARFPPGNLDPRAQEFRPNNFFTNPQVPLVPPPPQHQIFYLFPPPQTLPFTTDVPILGYHHQQYPPPTAYVRTSPSLPPEPASPTRTLVLSSVPCDVSETLIRRELEAFGEVRGVQMDRICDGIVTVHFYDLRHAESALNEIREQHMQHQARLRNIFTSFAQNSGHERTMVSLPLLPPPPPARGIVAGCAVWAQFVIPSCTAVPDGQNQGTIVVFNLDPNVSTKSLREIFQAFGEVKELRETPMKKQQRFVEFYDVRDAAKALREMNGKEIHAKQVLIEFSRPGGYGRKFLDANTSKAFCFSTSNHNCADNTKIFKHGPPQPPPLAPPPLPRRFSGFLPSSNNVSPRARIVVQSQSSSSAKGSPKESMNEKGSIEVSVSSLSLGGGDDGGVTEKAVDAPPKRNAKSKSCQSNSTVFKQQQRSKPWKGKQAKKLDTRFLINEEAMKESNCSTDSRTTVMIKNIPNKYSQKLLLNMLDNHCIHCNEQISEGDDDQPMSSYDFVYLPIDFNNKCNVGYGFVNMTSPQATWRLYRAFHHQHWEVFNSRKICEVTYARVQGLEALKEHFKNSKFPCEMDHYLPVVFSPPRDGRQQTEPIPIVGHKPIIFGLPSNKPTYDIDQMNGGDDLRNIKKDDTDQEEQEREGMMNCDSGSCSHSQNGGDMGDDDKDKA